MASKSRAKIALHRSFQSFCGVLGTLSRAAGFGMRRPGRRHRRKGFGHFENLEARQVMSGTPMQIGINLDNVNDYTPNWMFTDVMQSSRPWISHSTNTVTGAQDFNGGAFVPVQVDANGWPTQLATWSNAHGQLMQQRLGTLMFRELNGNYPAGTYRVEWAGTGDVQFSFDARETSRGRTADGRNFALLNVTPGNSGIYVGINSMRATDPIRDIHVWMPNYNGQSFAGQRWTPGATFSPFHPLYKERLDDFGILRFMQTQETVTSDIRTWADRRDANDSRQSSGNGGGGQFANGISVEHMVQLANELDADPWFNMPHMADDTFVRNFASYVRDNLEPGLTAYVEWSNEIWNSAPGFETYFWIADQIRLPENSGLTHWQFAGREAARDMNVWSNVFAGQTDRIVRVAAGQASTPWVTERIVENMGGSFDAISIAPYFGPGETQRATYSAATTVDQVLADMRGNIVFSAQMTLNHQRLTDDYATRLGRDIQLLAYEGGPHLNGNGASYQNALFQATKDPRMADITRDYLRMQNATGLDAYVHYKLTDRDMATQYGLFGVLLGQDQPLSQAHIYRALLDADAGTLFTSTPTLVTLNAADPTANEAGLGVATFRVTRGGNLAQPLTVNYSVGGNATAGVDYTALSGRVMFPANENTAFITVTPRDDATVETNETVIVTLQPGAGYSLISTAASTGSVSIVSDDVSATATTFSIVASDPNAAEAGRDPGVFTVTRSGNTTGSATVYLTNVQQTARAADYDALTLAVTFAAGQTSTTITVRPVDDTTVENTESVILSINPTTLYRIGANSQARVNIVDNDVAPPPVTPLVTIVATDSAAAEVGNNNGVYTLTRTGNLNSTLVARYTASGTATAGRDFAPLSGFAYFARGAATTTVTVFPYDDTAVEPVEAVIVSLTDGDAYDLGAARAATVTISRDDVASVRPLPVLIVIANNDFYYTEYSAPRAALEAAGIPVVVGAGRRVLSTPHANTGYTSGNGSVMPDIALADARASDYSAIVFVGGWGAAQYQYAFPGTYNNAAYNGTLAIREAANRLINEFVAQDKLVTGVCYGVSVLAWSRVNGQSLLQGRTATTAHFNSPTNNLPEAGLYRWHLETNGATAFTGGTLGDQASRFDDVLVDGRIVSGENFDSARLLGVTIADRLLNRNQPTTTLAATDATAAEAGRETGTLTVSRTGSSAAALAVYYALGGTAANGSDFDRLRGTVVIQPGQTTGAITVRPIDDTASESNETVTASLTSNSAYARGATTSGTVTIADNDNAPTQAPLPVRLVIASTETDTDDVIVNGRIITSGADGQPITLKQNKAHRTGAIQASLLGKARFAK